MNPPDEASVMMLQRMLAQLSGGGGGPGFGMPGDNDGDGDGGGPSLQDFMSPDGSFLHDLRQRREGAMEDFVAFEIYVDEEGKAGEAATAQQVAKRVLSVTQPYRETYIWHHETFAFLPTTSQAATDPAQHPHTNASPPSAPLLRGHVRVGENIEDEWFVVWLLHLATADPELASLGLSVHVRDADGNFLLIEAAMGVPDWLGPENSDYRVWMRGGKFHFLAEGDQQQPLEAGRAMELLKKKGSQKTLAPWLNEALDERLNVYPEAIEENKHRAACYVPLSVAALLSERPALVSAAIRILRGREPGELLALMKNNTTQTQTQTQTSQSSSGFTSLASPPRFPPQPLVPLRVTFSRYLFGQLEADELQPPKAYLKAIADVEVNHTHTHTHTRTNHNRKKEQEQQQSRVQAAIARGVRLACGLEMLYWRSKKGVLEDEEGEGEGEDTHTHTHTQSNEKEEWTLYLSKLRAKGFFDGLMEGSAEAKGRMAQAREAFKESKKLRHRGGGGGEGEGQEGGGNIHTHTHTHNKKTHEIIDAVLTSSENRRYNVQDFAQSVAELPVDDDEGWLEGGMGTLDALLEKYGQSLGVAGAGGAGGTGGAGGGERQAGVFSDEDDDDMCDSDDEEEEEERDADLEAIVEGMKGFIGAMSGLEGAEIGGDGIGAGRAGGGGGGGGVSFDVKRLLQILQGKNIEEALRVGRKGMMWEGGDSSEEKEEEEEEEEEEEGEGGDHRFADEKEEEKEAVREARAMMDSDDEEEDEEEENEEEEGEGMDFYMAQLEAELRGTTLAQSFERAPRPAAAAAGVAGEGGAAEGQGEGEGAEDLQPVDMDLNLVRHLLESVAAQGAQAGPASNLLGELMGGRKK